MFVMQEPMNTSSIFAPATVAGCVNSMRKRGPLKPGVPGHPKSASNQFTVIGIDPAMAGATGAVGVTGSTGTPGTYTESQNTLLGRGATAGTGAPQEISLGSGLDPSKSTCERIYQSSSYFAS